MSRRNIPKRLTGAQRLKINDSMYEFIRRIVADGVRDMLGPRAKKRDTEREISRRYSL